MVKKHMKALAAPVTWPMKRKGTVFVLRPKPGKKFEFSMPIALVFKNLLKYCKTMREVKSILQDKEVLIDGKRVKEPKALLGLMDVLSLPLSNEHFRMLINKTRKLELQIITKEEAEHKICKIIGKTTLKGKKTQLNLYDSRCILVSEDKFKVGDSIMISLPDQKIKKHYALAAGAYVVMITGSHVGEHGKIVSVDKGVVSVKGKTLEFTTPTESVFVVGKEHSEIKFD